MEGRALLAGPLAVCIRAYLPIPKSLSKAKRAAAILGDLRPTVRPDCDNFGKLALDALNTIAWRDDAQVVSLLVTKHYSERPRLDLTASEIGGGA